MKKVYFYFLLVCIFQFNLLTANAQYVSLSKAISTVVPANLVNFNGIDIVTTKQAANRAWVTSTDGTAKTLPFSTADGQKIFSGAGNTQCDFYGGAMVNFSPGMITSDPQLVLGSSTDYFKNKFGTNIDNGTSPSEFNAIFLWRKDQFTNLPIDNVSFNNSDNCKIDINLLTVLDQWDAPSQFRFVIKNGLKYYISEFVSENATGLKELVGFGNSSVTGKRWGIFNPVADNFAIPVPLPDFSAVDFNDVQEVGFIYHARRPQWGHSFTFDKLEVVGLVTPVSVTSISLNPKVVAIQPGGFTNLIASISPANATNQAITFVSGNENVATVDATGKVSAIAIGSAYIKVKSNENNLKDSTLVYVQGPILTCDFSGIAPAANLPWSKTTFLDSHIIFNGLNLGAGVIPGRLDNSFNGPQIDNVFALAIDASATPSTLQEAITKNEYVTFNVAPILGSKLNLNASLVTFKIKLNSGNAPKTYSILTSINGFTAGNEIYTSPSLVQWSTDEQAITFNFPSTGYDNITNPFELRIYMLNAQYSFHSTAITAWTMTGLVSDLATGLPINKDNMNPLIVYPNPAVDRLSLNFGSLMGKATVSIVDLQGRNIIIRSEVNTQIETLDVSSLSSGIYFIKVNQGDKTYNTKFVKK